MPLIYIQKPLKQKHTKRNVTFYEAGLLFFVLVLLFSFSSVDCCVFENRLESKYTEILNRNRQTFIEKISKIIMNL